MREALEKILEDSSPVLGHVTLETLRISSGSSLLFFSLCINMKSAEYLIFYRRNKEICNLKISATLSADTRVSQDSGD